MEVATAIRDELGYDLLTSVTGVDYLPENKMEVVYHAFKTTGGPVLNFKVQVPRDGPGGSALAVARSGPAPSSRSAKPGICSASNSPAILTCAAS